MGKVGAVEEYAVGTSDSTPAADDFVEELLFLRIELVPADFR